MKKTLTLILALLLVCVFTTTALAGTDKGKAWGKDNPKKVVETQKNNSPGKEKGWQQNSKKVEKVFKKSLQEKLKKSLLDQYRAEKQKKNKARTWKFSDIYQHWAAQCIDEMAAIGLLKGYPDGTFKPDQKLTQAEALSLVMRVIADAADVTIEDADEDDLSAIPEWVRNDCRKAAYKGIIKLNRFHAGVQASRAETAVMIAKALGLEPVDTSNMPFKDGILISKEDVGYILALYEEGILSGDPNGNFNPNSAITRAQMASMLQRLLDKGEIDSITLPATAIVEQGKSITLEAIVKYSDGSTDNNVEWESSDTTLATVNDDGVVTAADDKTGVVTIKATASRGSSTMSASCKVTIVEKNEIITGVLEETGEVGSHDGKVFQEYTLEADGERISLDKDKVKSITLQKKGSEAVTLTPNSDNNLWFNVQHETGEYTLTVVDKDDKVYEAVIDWVAPFEVAAIATGNSGEKDGNKYVEFRLGDLNLSSFDYMFQIKPNGEAVELTANSDTNLWFKTNNQVKGTHVFLVRKNDVWYYAKISI